MNIQTRIDVAKDADVRKRSHIAVSLRDRIKLVSLDDIYYFKAENKYIVIHTKSEQHLITGTLNDLEKELGEGFIRIHRNVLVSTRYLEGLEKNEDARWCVLFGGIDDKLEISRRQTPNIRKWLRSGIKY